jgi:hypothetical protein
MLEKLTRDTFAQHLNTQFRVQNSATNSVSVELVQVAETRSSPGYESFSIEFRGPSDAFLPQGMYPVEHDQLGALDLFIVPIRKDKDGVYYEACFNRLLSGE